MQPLRPPTVFLRSAVLPLLLLTLVAPARSEVIRIDPFATPKVTLPPDEAARLQTLLSAAFPPLISDVSPDDRTILTATPEAGVAFLDLQTKATTPVAPQFYGYQSLSAFRWRDRGRSRSSRPTPPGIRSWCPCRVPTAPWRRNRWL